MDVEDAQDCCNGDNVGSRTSNNSSLSSKVGQKSGLERFQDDEEEEETTQGVYDGSRAFVWQNSSRIVRVSRASGGKDRHSKVWTSKGLRDRRVRLSVSTAIQFYDLQDRLGVDQPSKAVDWLIKAAAGSIADLPPLNTSSFLEGGVDRDVAIMEIEKGSNDQRKKLVRACSSSTSETSKGSGLSLSRSEGRLKARERARERAAKEKEKEKENPMSHNSSTFTELLTAGISNSSSAQDNSNVFGLMGSPSLGQLQMQQPLDIPHFSLSGYHNHQQHQQQQQQHFSFMPETASESDYNNLSFTISSTSGLAAGFNNSRGTLQSNFLMPQHEHNLHRFSPLDDASNLPFLMNSTTSSVSSSMENHQSHQFPNGFDPRLHLYYDGGRHSDHKGKGKS